MANLADLTIKVEVDVGVQELGQLPPGEYVLERVILTMHDDGIVYTTGRISKGPLTDVFLVLRSEVLRI